MDHLALESSGVVYGQFPRHLAQHCTEMVLYRLLLLFTVLSERLLPVLLLFRLFLLCLVLGLWLRLILSRVVGFLCPVLHLVACS